MDSACNPFSNGFSSFVFGKMTKGLMTTGSTMLLSDDSAVSSSVGVGARIELRLTARNRKKVIFCAHLFKEPTYPWPSYLMVVQLFLASYLLMEKWKLKMVLIFESAKSHQLPKWSPFRTAQPSGSSSSDLQAAPKCYLCQRSRATWQGIQPVILRLKYRQNIKNPKSLPFHHVPFALLRLVRLWTIAQPLSVCAAPLFSIWKIFFN